MEGSGMEQRSHGMAKQLNMFDPDETPRNSIPRRRDSCNQNGPQRPSRNDLRGIPGNHRSIVTTPGYHLGRKPGNAGCNYPPEPVTPKILMRLVGACGGGNVGCRDRALYTFLWGTAARISEALDLMPAELDFDEKKVTILRGKGGKRRTVGLSEQTITALQKWLVVRAELGIGDNRPVFCVVGRPTRGKRLYSSCVREQLRDCAKRAGIRQRINPHAFRHGQAVYQIKLGRPINVVSKMLGHSNSAITARYIDHVDQDEQLDALRDMTWDEEAADA
jgi:integrase